MGRFENSIRQVYSQFRSSGEVSGFTVSGDPVDLSNFFSGGLNLQSTDIRQNEGEVEELVKQFDGKKFEVRTPENTVLGIAKATVSEMGSPDVNFSFDRNGFVDRVRKNGGKIPEKIAKYRGVSQYKAGGNFEVDTDINDFDDALASLGLTKLKFIAEDKTGNQKVKKTASKVKDKAQNLSEKQKLGLGLAAGGAAVSLALTYFVTGE